MARTFYVPVNSLSKQAKQWYVPVNGLSKRAVKAYCPVNGLSKLFWDGGKGNDLLWNYVADNRSAILYGGNTYEVTLHGAIENYQSIILEIRAYYSDDVDNFIIIPKKMLQESYIANRTLVGTNKGIWKDRFAVFDMSGTSLKKVFDNYGRYYGNSMGLVNVWGIREQCTNTLLWDYQSDYSGSIPYGAVTLTLRDDIENYDKIVVEIASANDFGSVGTMMFTMMVKAIKNGYRPYYFNHTSYSDRASVYHAQGTTFEKVANNIANTNGIIKIWGVKYVF